ncbi:agmatinase [Bacteroidota bacterium]
MKKNSFGDFSPKYRNKKKANIVVLPILYDKTSTWIRGSDNGPKAILEASYNLEFYDIETNSEVYKKGIYTDKPITGIKSPEKLVKKVEEVTLKWLSKNKFMIALGGEHTISVGVVKAYSKIYNDISVLQLDAHTDLRDSYMGSKYNHACVMSRIKEICPIVQVGIRSMDIEEKAKTDNDKIFYAEKIYDNDKWMKSAIKKLSENVYITIDLDVFDPSIMPSTGTPEPGGLLWYQVLKFLKLVSLQKKIIGFDVVELCPDKHNKAPDYMAAKLIYKLLSNIFN